MIDINVPNAVTIGIIGIVFYAAVKFGLRAAGISTPLI